MRNLLLWRPRDIFYLVLAAAVCAFTLIMVIMGRQEALFLIVAMAILAIATARQLMRR
jgi:hypothetical protein